MFGWLDDVYNIEVLSSFFVLTTISHWHFKSGTTRYIRLLMHVHVFISRQVSISLQRDPNRENTLSKLMTLHAHSHIQGIIRFCMQKKWTLSIVWWRGEIWMYIYSIYVFHQIIIWIWRGSKLKFNDVYRPSKSNGILNPIHLFL